MNLPFAKPDLHEANLWLEMGSPKSFKDVTPSDLECALTYFFTGLTQHSDAQASKVAELRQQLSEAQSRIELLEHDAKTGDYETLYAQTVVELSAAQVSEAELLKALETFFECRGSDSYSCGLLSNEGLALIATHKERKDRK